VVGLIKLEGITPEESVFHSIRCTYENLWGDLAITNKGIVFLVQQLDFDEIDLIKTKKKNSGIFKHCIAISYHSNQLENQTYCFSCEKYKAVLFLALYERQKLSLKTPEESSSAIQSLSKFKRHGDLLNVAKNPKMKPYVTAFFLEKTEATILSQLRNSSGADLFEVAKNKQVHSLVARLHESDPKQLSKDQAYYTVTGIVAHLISRRALDGIITEVGSYVSNRDLARRKVPYDMLADFEEERCRTIC